MISLERDELSNYKNNARAFIIVGDFEGGRFWLESVACKRKMRLARAVSRARVIEFACALNLVTKLSFLS